MKALLSHAAVIGAGVMGSQIAAHLANAGVTVDLLDVVPADLPSHGGDRSALARSALRRLETMKPSPIFSKASLSRIRAGNIEDDLSRLGHAQWVIEAVVEELAPKRELWARIESVASAEAVLATNTSGLPVHSIAEGRGDGFRSRFLGTHFFNPPRYLKLLEVIPTPDTSPDVVGRVRAWAEEDLGKGVVIAEDTPNFIANRLGILATMATLRAMAAHGLAPDAVDALTGTVIGHPRSATFRTLDLVGLDTVLLVAKNLRERLPADEAALFEVPPYLEEMARRGWLGNKAGQGFYRRAAGSVRTYEVLDLETLAYRPQRRPSFPSLDAARRAPDLPSRISTLAYGDDEAAGFVWRVLKETLLYAAGKAGEIARGETETVDAAMRWGFGWELGPFETWEALGIERASRRMAEEGETIPSSVAALMAEGASRFPRPRTRSGEETGHLSVIPSGEGDRVVWRNAEATLLDLGDEVAALDLHGPKDAIGLDLIAALGKAADEVEANWRGLVVVNRQSANFSVGANLLLVLMAAEGGQWDQVASAVRALQGANMRLKYLGRPVVAAPWGMALGGGAEICLHAARIQAGGELYIGLVEAGAGVIPAGGGTKELLARTVAALPAGAPWSPHDAGGGRSDTYFDPQPFVARTFETIAMAKVSTSAVEGRDLGFLSPSDRITMNRDRLVADAKEVVRHLDRMGYRPPDRTPIPVPGREVRGLLEVGIAAMRRGGFISDHDALIASRLAYVLTGGDRPEGTPVDEETILELETEAFLALVGEEKTRARMRHLLQTGRPLRN